MPNDKAPKTFMSARKGAAKTSKTVRLSREAKKAVAKTKIEPKKITRLVSH